jgi:hypothetical protein
MQIIRRILAGCLLCAGFAHARQPHIDSSITFVNYQRKMNVESIDAYSEQGFHLAGPRFLSPSSNSYTGATMSGVDPGSGLPQWLEFTWQEWEVAKDIPNDVWDKLDRAAQDAYVAQKKALPLKRQRVAIRGILPDAVVTELEQSPLDPERASLRLKSLKLFFIWTQDGLKVRWRMRQGCCTVIREGGDDVPPR